MTSSCASAARLLTCVDVHAERLEVDLFEHDVPPSTMKTTIAALALTLGACGGSNYGHTEIVSVEGTSGGSALEVTYTHGQSNGRGMRFDVVEEGIELRIAAFWDQGTQSDDIELVDTATVDLDRPLGDRRITVLGPRQPVAFTCIVDDAPSQRCATSVESLP